MGSSTSLSQGHSVARRAIVDRLLREELIDSYRLGTVVSNHPQMCCLADTCDSGVHVGHSLDLGESADL